MRDDQGSKAAKPRLLQTIEAQPLQENGAKLTMRLGERLHLEITGTGERLWGELAGFKQGVFLLVWLPSLPQHKALVDNASVTVRGLNIDFQLCGFKTTVSKALHSPYPLLLLAFPERFEKIHLRRHDRVDCFLPALVLLEGHEHKSIIVNLSQGGARIILDQADDVPSPEHFEGQEVYLVFKTVENGKEVCAKALVRSSIDCDARVALGLEFHDFIGDAHAVIHKYVRSLKEYSALK